MRPTRPTRPSRCRVPPSGPRPGRDSRKWTVRAGGRVRGLLPPFHPPLRQLGMVVLVVPVPPVIRRGLRIALGRVFPVFLAPERGHVEVAPGAPEGLVAAVIDEVGSEYPVAIAEECVRAVIFVDTKVGLEPIGD